MESTESSCALRDAAARGTAWGESLMFMDISLSVIFFKKQSPAFIGVHYSGYFKIVNDLIRDKSLLFMGRSIGILGLYVNGKPATRCGVFNKHCFFYS